MKRHAVLSAALFFAICSTIQAQDQDPAAEPPAEPAAPMPPVYRGRDQADGVANRQLGATYELASGARLVVPAGLPIGTRTLRFSTSRGRLNTQEIAAGFRALGSPYAFDAAIDATRAPVELSVPVRRFRVEPDKRLVLAVESPGICDSTHRSSLGGSMCSAWEVLEARYDEAAQRVIARVPTPSGLRMVFGWIPNPPPAPPSPASREL